MSYQAIVLKIMLASPSDVSQERRIARDVINEWNVVHAEDRGIVLMPVGWETHSFPEMGDRPQALINKRLLTDCDLLLAIFWTRLGSPTGKASSGTVEEIEEHIRAGKQAFIYFSSAPVRPDSVDNNQYSELLKFKAKCKERGLIEEYEDLAAFRDKLSRHLSQKLISDYPSKSPRESSVEGSPVTNPPLSDIAKELLREASKDQHGVIMRVGTLGGTYVQTNGRDFVELGSARSDAKWRGAVDELERERFVEDRTGKGEVFFVTDAGYAAADVLSAS